MPASNTTQISNVYVRISRWHRKHIKYCGWCRWETWGTFVPPSKNATSRGRVVLGLFTTKRKAVFGTAFFFNQLLELAHDTPPSSKEECEDLKKQALDIFLAKTQENQENQQCFPMYCKKNHPFLFAYNEMQNKVQKERRKERRDARLAVMEADAAAAAAAAAEEEEEEAMNNNNNEEEEGVASLDNNEEFVRAIQNDNTASFRFIDKVLDGTFDLNMLEHRYEEALMYCAVPDKSDHPRMHGLGCLRYNGKFKKNGYPSIKIGKFMVRPWRLKKIIDAFRRTDDVDKEIDEIAQQILNINTESGGDVIVDFDIWYERLSSEQKALADRLCDLQSEKSVQEEAAIMECITMQEDLLKKTRICGSHLCGQGHHGCFGLHDVDAVDANPMSARCELSKCIVGSKEYYESVIFEPILINLWRILCHQCVEPLGDATIVPRYVCFGHCHSGNKKPMYCQQVWMKDGVPAPFDPANPPPTFPPKLPCSDEDAARLRSAIKAAVNDFVSTMPDELKEQVFHYILGTVVHEMREAGSVTLNASWWNRHGKDEKTRHISTMPLKDGMEFITMLENEPTPDLPQSVETEFDRYWPVWAANTVETDFSLERQKHIMLCIIKKYLTNEEYCDPNLRVKVFFRNYGRLGMSKCFSKILMDYSMRCVKATPRNVLYVPTSLRTQAEMDSLRESFKDSWFVATPIIANPDLMINFQVIYDEITNNGEEQTLMSVRKLLSSIDDYQKGEFANIATDQEMIRAYLQNDVAPLNFS